MTKTELTDKLPLKYLNEIPLILEMNLNEQLTEIVLERVDTSTKELSNNASKQLRKRNLDGKFSLLMCLLILIYRRVHSPGNT